MVALFNAETNEEIGHISQRDLERLIVILEDKGEEIDSEFHIDDEIIGRLESGGLRPLVVEMLSEALGDSNSIQIAYEED